MGAINAVISPAISGATKAGSRFLREQVSPRVINSLVKPVSKEFEFGRNAGRGVVREGIKAVTRGSLAKKLTLAKKGLGVEIDSVLKGVAGKKVDISPALNQVQKLVKQANKQGNPELATAIERVIGQITNVYDPSTGAVKRARNLVMSPLNARRLKTNIGNSVKWYNQAFDNDVNQARVAAYRAIRDAINKAVPGVKGLNSRYSDIFSAERAVKRQISLGERQNMVGLLPSLAGGATALASGGLSAGGLVQGAIAAGAVKALGSTAAKTYLEEPLVRGAARLAQGVGKATPAISGLAGKLTNVLPDKAPADVSIDSEYPQFKEQISEARRMGIPDNEIAAYLQEKVGR